MFVKPNSGLKVRDPVTKGFLPEDGAEVPNSIYWSRRLRDKDVVQATPPSQPSPAARERIVAEEESGK